MRTISTDTNVKDYCQRIASSSNNTTIPKEYQPYIRTKRAQRSLECMGPRAKTPVFAPGVKPPCPASSASQQGPFREKGIWEINLGKREKGKREKGGQIWGPSEHPNKRARLNWMSTTAGPGLPGRIGRGTREGEPRGSEFFCYRMAAAPGAELGTTVSGGVSDDSPVLVSSVNSPNSQHAHSIEGVLAPWLVPLLDEHVIEGLAQAWHTTPSSLTEHLRLSPGGRCRTPLLPRGASPGGPGGRDAGLRVCADPKPSPRNLAAAASKGGFAV